MHYMYYIHCINYVLYIVHIFSHQIRITSKCLSHEIPFRHNRLFFTIDDKYYCIHQQPEMTSRWSYDFI